MADRIPGCQFVGNAGDNRQMQGTPVFRGTGRRSARRMEGADRPVLSFFMNELIFFHRASRTAIIADLSQTFSETFLKRHWPWWMRPIAKLSKMVEGWGHPPIDYRISFRDRASARPKFVS
ncbi:hypothetical protein [Mesorhizobium sp. M0220]|uniref:hypothetical protein n=1 Tax=Mesorhizobium sp. M0220 TaxID=2956920 RepID=UPI0033355BB0